MVVPGKLTSLLYWRPHQRQTRTPESRLRLQGLRSGCVIGGRSEGRWLRFALRVLHSDDPSIPPCPGVLWVESGRFCRPVGCMHGYADLMYWGSPAPAPHGPQRGTESPWGLGITRILLVSPILLSLLLGSLVCPKGRRCRRRWFIHRTVLVECSVGLPYTHARTRRRARRICKMHACTRATSLRTRGHPSSTLPALFACQGAHHRLPCEQESILSPREGCLGACSCRPQPKGKSGRSEQ
jgi:hypothetical protein